MKTLESQLKLVAHAEALVAEACGEVSKALAKGADNLMPAFQSQIGRALADIRTRLTAEKRNLAIALEERKTCLAAEPILQVEFVGAPRKRSKSAPSVRLVVSRPNSKCGEPFINEPAFNALAILLGATKDTDAIRARADFAVAVIDRGGLVIRRIPNVEPTVATEPTV